MTQAPGKAYAKTNDADACVEYGPRLSLKALVLLLVSSAVFGSSYCFHNPAALKNQLQEHFLGAMEKNEFEVLFVSHEDGLWGSTVLTLVLGSVEHAVHSVLDAQYLPSVRWRPYGRQVWR